MLTYEQVKYRLNYNPETGDLTWTDNVKKRGWVEPGKKAGNKCAIGYMVVTMTVDKVRHQLYAHRVAWLLTHDKWPDNQIDHINGERVDNRLINLRDVTLQENRKNMKKPTNNTSGEMGVVWDKGRQKWQARIRVNGKDMYLGRFKDFDAALARRKQAEIEHGFHANHGRTG